MTADDIQTKLHILWTPPGARRTTGAPIAL
jgi:hypothetical protein